jgi:HK97 family phage major capsid protein
MTVYSFSKKAGSAMNNIRELLQKRASLWDDAKKFLDDHTDKDGKISAEDAAAYDKMEADIDAMSKSIERHERNARIGAELDKPFKGNFTNGGMLMKTHQRGVVGDEYRGSFLNAIRTNFRDAQNFLREGTLSDGGYLLPTEFDDAIVSKLQNENVLRQIGKTITTASTHEVPVVSAQPVANWIGEGAEITFSNTSFERVTLTAHKLATSILCSNELLADTFYNLETFLIDEFGRSLARAEEEAFLNGTGQDNQPLGLLPTLAQSASSTLQTTGAEISADDLIGLMYSVDRPYRRNGSWLFNDATLANIRRLKDSTQNFLWQPSLAEGEPPTLLGRPVCTSSYMPPSASGNTAVLFGDFSFFVIGDRGQRQFRPLRELYAMSDKTAFLMLERVDCALVDRHAIRGLTIR